MVLRFFHAFCRRYPILFVYYSIVYVYFKILSLLLLKIALSLGRKSRRLGRSVNSSSIFWSNSSFLALINCTCFYVVYGFIRNQMIVINIFYNRGVEHTVFMFSFVYKYYPNLPSTVHAVANHHLEFNHHCDGTVSGRLIILFFAHRRVESSSLSSSPVTLSSPV